jgi:TPR repeat protein
MDRFTLARAVGIMLVLTFVAGTFVYHREVGQALIWLGGQIAGAPADQPSPENGSDGSSPTSSAPQNSSSSPAAAAATEPTSHTPPLELHQSTAPSPAPTAAQTKSVESTPSGEKLPLSQSKSGDAGTLVPATQVDRTPRPPAIAESAPDAGQQEFQQAQQILRNKTREAELPEAVRLLWVGVEKGNAAAEVALADLYRTGQGVARNCDQARILLTAAARKGNAEAQKHLEQLQREGCAE